MTQSEILLPQLRRRIADLRGRGVYSGWPNVHKAIFIHLPKTGGSSVAKQLGQPASRHVTVQEYRLANPKKFANFFKFAFVRNPFDRLLSSYAFLKAGGMNHDDARFARRHVSPFETFEHFLTEGFTRSEETRAWIHFRTQTEFICDSDGRNLMDFTGRFEQLPQDYARVASRFGKPTDLPVTNRSDRGDYKAAYTDSMREIAERFYQSDLQTFGYSFDI